MAYCLGCDEYDGSYMLQRSYKERKEVSFNKFKYYTISDKSDISELQFHAEN